MPPEVYALYAIFEKGLTPQSSKNLCPCLRYYLLWHLRCRELRIRVLAHLNFLRNIQQRLEDDHRQAQDPIHSQTSSRNP